MRIESYLCRILAVLVSGGFGGSDAGYQRLMIGYQEQEQTLEEAYREMSKLG